MEKKLFIGLISLLVLFGCNDAGKNSSNANTDQVNQRDPSYKDTFSEGDYNFQIEYDNRLDTSYFDAVYKGKKIGRKGYSGKIERSFLADLNRDSKHEVYLEMKKESASKVFGYFLNNGELINITIVQPRHLKNVAASSYTVERKQLVGLYDTFNDEKKLIKHKSKFNLIKRGEEYVLLPQGFPPKVMENKSGQYLSKSSSDPNHYKSLIIGKREGGYWRVELSVKRKSDKKVICEFVGMGEFIDQDLYVTLDQADPSLKGTLQIRFLDLTATVYTEEQEHSKELISFCPEKKSIAGRFKKTDI